MTLANNQLLNERYEIIKSIGCGGMAEVYLARDTVLDRKVAIKMLRDQFVTDKALLDQFRREARSAAKLVHPNIINVYDVSASKEGNYIVMEYVEGITLKHFMEQNKLNVVNALDIAINVAEGLRHAHLRNIVHCDIKPLNILIDKNLNPKIADFGIAKMVSNQTQVYTNAIMGSVHYISPEQASGDTVTGLSDIYSLGVVLFEMLTGQVPFNGDTPVSVAMMHTKKSVPPLSQYMDDVPDGLQSIIDKAMAKKPEERYQSADDFKNALISLRLELAPDPSYKAALGVAADPSSFKVDDDDQGGDGSTRRSTMVMNPVRTKKDSNDFADTLVLGHGKAVGAAGENNNKLENDIKKVLEDLKQKEEAKLATRKKINYTKLLLWVTGIVVVISVIAHFIFSGPKAVVEVPNVVNKTTVEAEKELKSLKLKVQLDEKFGDITKFKPGTVMEQSVLAGSKRKEGSLIILTVSKGAEEKGVPELKGMSLNKATIVLEELGFKVGKVERKYVKNEKMGAVLEQKPKAAEKLAKGSAVDIVMNEGNIEIPKITGKKQEEAAALLKGVGLVLGNVTTITDENVAKGVVVSCNPDVGARLGDGDKVDITISDGGSAKDAYVDFAIPGSKMSKVDIIVEDNGGKRSIYSGMKKGGIRIRQKVETRGKAKAILMVDGQVAEERTL